MVIIFYGYIFSDNLITVAEITMLCVSNIFGYLYIAFVLFLYVFLTWLAFSKYGKIRLGRDGDKPEYSNFSWYVMLFCGGTGIGFVFWSIAEPLSHYAEPPEGINARTIEAANFSIRTCFLNWSIVQWICFVIVWLGIAYFIFRKGKNAQISNLLPPLVGVKLTNGWLGKVVDIFSVVVSFAEVATSFGIGISQICGGLSYLFYLPNNETTWLIIIVAITCIFLASAIIGVSKGIKILSKYIYIYIYIYLLYSFTTGFYCRSEDFNVQHTS